MTVVQSLAAFVAAAGLLTMTPGLDTALVLRAATADGPRRGARAALGITLGCLIWGVLVACGLAALIAASRTAFDLLKWAGALYLFWLGGRLLLKPRLAWAPTAAAETGRQGWFWKGLAGNLLNPKMGVFYVSFLPQFVPAGVAIAPFVMFLAAIHAALGLAWCAVLIAASGPIGRSLRRPAVIKGLDRITGLVFIGFGARLLLAER